VKNLFSDCDSKNMGQMGQIILTLLHCTLDGNSQNQNIQHSHPIAIRFTNLCVFDKKIC
jgi:hypothetical protein